MDRRQLTQHHRHASCALGFPFQRHGWPVPPAFPMRSLPQAVYTACACVTLPAHHGRWLMYFFYLGHYRRISSVILYSIHNLMPTPLSLATSALLPLPVRTCDGDTSNTSIQRWLPNLWDRRRLGQEEQDLLDRPGHHPHPHHRLLQRDSKMIRKQSFLLHINLIRR
jgi:hypothetical protein